MAGVLFCIKLQYLVASGYKNLYNMLRMGEGYACAKVETTAHIRTVCVEDSHYLDVKAVLTMIVEKERLSRPLPFIIATAYTVWIDTSPVGFRLRMYFRVPVHLAG